MGQATGCMAESRPTVLLHIYDVGGHEVTQSMNNFFRAIGTGAFHAGVEIYGQEYSYGYCQEGSGMMVMNPRFCPPHKYRETLDMGETPLAPPQVRAVLERLKEQWPGSDYDLLRRNCCHFSDALIRELQVGPMPPWVTNLAGAGATLQHGTQQAYVAGGVAVDKAKQAAIIAAAKAGELDQQYQIQGTVRAKAADLMQKAGELDNQYNITARASVLAQNVGSALASGAQVAHARAVELDRQHRITEQASAHASRISSQVVDAAVRFQDQGAAGAQQQGASASSAPRR